MITSKLSIIDRVNTNNRNNNLVNLKRKIRKKLTTLRLDGSLKLALICMSDWDSLTGAFESICNEIFIPESLHLTLLWLALTSATDVAIVARLLFKWPGRQTNENKWRTLRARAISNQLFFFCCFFFCVFLSFFSRGVVYHSLPLWEEKKIIDEMKSDVM